MIMKNPQLHRSKVSVSEWPDSGPFFIASVARYKSNESALVAMQSRVYKMRDYIAAESQIGEGPYF